MSYEETILSLSECNERIDKLKQELKESEQRFKILAQEHEVLLLAYQEETEIPLLCDSECFNA